MKVLPVFNDMIPKENINKSNKKTYLDYYEGTILLKEDQKKVIIGDKDAIWE